MAAREPAQPERLGPHQRACLDAVCGAYGKGDRSIAFQMATGSGKTHVLLAIPGALRLARVVYVFPSLVLINQFIAKYLGTEKYREAFPHYAVCSSEADAFKDAAACVPFDAWMCAGDQYAVLTTYASLQRVLETAPTANCVVFDEAHHTGADGCKKTMEAFAGCVIRASATLRAGETPCYTYMLSEAIADNVCRDFNTYFFVRPKGDEKRLVEFLEGHRMATLEDDRKRNEACKRDEACEKDEACKNVEAIGNGRVMAFTQWSEAEGRSSGTNVNEFCKAHDEGIRALGGKLWSITAKDNKEAILDDFEKSPDDKLSVLVSCRTLSEGVDTKRANVALFVDAVSSTTTIVQRIGRVTRVERHPDGTPLAGQPLAKQRPGSVIVNVYIDPAAFAGKDKDEIDELLIGAMESPAGDFRAIIGVMAALKISDPERYEQAINFAALQRGAKDGAAGAGDDAVGAVGAATAATASGAAKGSREPSGPDTAAAPPRSRIFLDIHSSLKMVLKLDEGLDTFAQRFDAVIKGDDSSPEEKAFKRANGFKAFYEANGKSLPRLVARTPSSRHVATAEQIHEQDCAQWFVQMKQAKNGTSKSRIYPRVEQLLVSLLGENWYYSADLEALALAHANEIKAFYEAHAREPRACAKNKGNDYTESQISEQKLSQWFSTMKRIRRGEPSGGSLLYDSVERVFIEVLRPNWYELEDLELEAFQRATDIKMFYDANQQKMPLSTSQNAQEAALGRCFNKMKLLARGSVKGPRYLAAEKIIEECLGPDWYKLVDLEANAMENVSNFIKYFEAHGMPATKCKPTSDEENEHQLATWFQYTARARRGDKTGARRYEVVEHILEERLGADWFISRDFEKDALKRLDDFKQFHTKHNRKPNSRILEETQLASWFSNTVNCKRGTIKKPRYLSVENALEDLLGPDWYKPVDPEAQALQRANDFKSFHDLHGMPKQLSVAKKLSATGVQLDGHSHAGWFSGVKQIRNGSRGARYASVEQFLEELLGPSWFIADGRRNAGSQPQPAVHMAVTQLADRPVAASSSAGNVVDSNTKTIPLSKPTQEVIPAVLATAPAQSVPKSKMSTPTQPPQEPTASAAEPATKPARRAPKAKMSALPQEAAIAEPPATKPARRGPKAMTRAPPGPPQAADAAEPAGGDRAPRALAEISALHKKYKSMRSDNLAALFREQPALWTEYHDIADANEAGFPADEVPHQRVAARLRAYFAQIPAGKPKTIVDLGCGRARLHGLFAGRPGLTFVNIDHVAGAAGITVGDIAHTGLEAGAADVAVLCLALWGSNCDEYFAEAHRILDPGGRLIVVEPGERWRDAETGLSAHNLRDALARHGFAVAHEEVMAGGREQRFALFEAQKCAPHSVVPHSVAPHSVAPPKLDHQQNGTPPLAGVVAANSWRVLINGDLWDYEKYRADFNARPMPLFPQSKGRRHMVSLPRRGDSVSFVLGQKIVMKGTVASDKFEVGTAHQEDPYNKGERRGHAEPSEFAWIQIESVGLSIDIRRTGQSTWAKMPA